MKESNLNLDEMWNLYKLIEMCYNKVRLGRTHTVLLIDKWRDQEAIDKHHASEMMGKISELREKNNLHMRVERYVEDAEGIPKSDKSFIRGVGDGNQCVHEPGGVSDGGCSEDA